MAGERPARPSEKPFRLQFRGAAPGLPEPGTTPHAMMILLAVEIGALVWLRRYMRGAHGG